MRKYSRLGVGNHGLNAGAALASCLALGKSLTSLLSSIKC